MSIQKIFNLVTRFIPETNETGWGEQVTAMLVDVLGSNWTTATLDPTLKLKHQTLSGVVLEIEQLSGAVAVLVTHSNDSAAALHVAHTSAAAGPQRFMNLVGANGQTLATRQKTVLLTLNGNPSPVSASALIPAGSFVIGVTARVTTTATGTGLTGLDIGDGTSSNIFTATGPLALTAGTTSDLTKFANRTSPLIYNADTAVQVTGVGLTGNFTAGVIRLTVHYLTLFAPTS